MSLDEFEAACDKVIKGWKAPKDFNAGRALNLKREFAPSIFHATGEGVRVNTLAGKGDKDIVVTVKSSEHEYKTVISWAYRAPKKKNKAKA